MAKHFQTFVGATEQWILCVVLIIGIGIIAENFKAICCWIMRSTAKLASSVSRAVRRRRFPRKLVIPRYSEPYLALATSDPLDDSDPLGIRLRASHTLHYRSESAQPIQQVSAISASRSNSDEINMQVDKFIQELDLETL